MSKITEFTLLREKAGLDILQTADLLDVSERTAYRYEGGTSQPSKLAIRALETEAETALCDPSE